MGLRQIIAADLKRHNGAEGALALIRHGLLKRTFRPVLTLRLTQACGPLRPLFRILHRMACARAGIDLPWDTAIGPGFRIVHGYGLVVNRAARIGSNVTVFQGVTIGQRDGIADGIRTTGTPHVGDNVLLGPYAQILGVAVGGGSIVAPMSVVLTDILPRSHAAGNPAAVIRQDIDFTVAFPGG